MTYFAGIKTLLVLKARYRELCKIHHPDLGGDTATMQAINAEYDTALRYVHDDKGETLNEEAQGVERDLMEVINKIVALQGLVIEVTGRWIWVTGATYQYRETLKNLAFRWAHKKCAWYWRPADAIVKNRHPLTLDQIRSKFGSINIGTEDRLALA